ncbi:ABC transporter permease subunit [Paractinoplanes durhamensis]|uniref:ABC transporter permease subunit n=1 Tax=Paractinoplanes durhamensis TaxID=113563 RepID=UPI003633538D
MRVFRKAVRDNRRAWLGWIVALTAVAAMYASFYRSIDNPAMTDALNSFPQALKEAFHLQDYTQPANYFAASVFGLLVPILVAVFAIAAGVKAVAGDEEAGTLDLVLAQPVGRVSLALQRFLAVAAAMVAAAAVMCLVVIALRGRAGSPPCPRPAGRDLPAAGPVRTAVRRARLRGRRLDRTPRPGARRERGRRRARLSGRFVLHPDQRSEVDGEALPFDWYLGGEPLKHGVQWGHAGLLLGFAVLFVAAGTWRFNRRDLSSS